MPQALSVIWDLVKYEKKSPAIAQTLLKFDSVLGLQIDKEENMNLPEDVLEIIKQRNIARENKDWNKSDELRDKLINLGYTVKDTKEGTSVTFNK